MKIFISFILVVFLTLDLNSQNAETIIEKLKTELKSTSDLIKTATIYSDLTWHYSAVSTDSALTYGEKALLASTKLKDSAMIAQVYSDIGAAYFRKGDFEQSKQNYLNAYTIRKARKDSKGLARLNNNLANIHEKTQNYTAAMTSYLEALKYFESVNEPKTTNIIKCNIGLVLLKIKNYDKAFAYINDVVAYQEEINSNEGLCVSCLNLGNVYLQLHDTVNALKMYNRSIKACKIVGNKKGISSGYNNIAAIKVDQNKAKDAILLLNKSKKSREELNSELDKANFDFNLANTYISDNQFIIAKNLLLSVEKLFSKINNKEKLQLNYKSLILVYANLNQPDSVVYFTNKLLILNNDLVHSIVLKQTAELETKYQTAKKEKLLLLKEAETKQKNILLFRISLLTFLISLFGFIVYKQQRLKHKQQEQEFNLKTAIATIENQNKLQEQRLSISRDLHDNIGSQLTFIISSVDNIKYAFDLKNSKLDDKLSSISSFATSTIIELRDTIWAMNSDEIKFEDLELRILNLIDKAKDVKSNINFNFLANDLAKKLIFKSFVGMNIYRTIQEAINNSLKYANANQISIEINKVENQTFITIQDNGSGFDENTVEKGNGLNNMRKRMQEIDGNFKIESNENGTIISLTF